MKCFTELYAVILAMLLINNLSAQHSDSSVFISLEIFEQKLRQSHNPQILDVRSSREFSENHLKGAINLNASDEETFKKGIETLDKQRPVFVYSINNGRSGVVAGKLRAQGFAEVYELPGGLAHWIGAGKPVESAAGDGISKEEFQKLAASDNVVLVDVGSKHCGSCRRLDPIVDAIAQDQAVKVIKIELYDNRALARELEIESVPTLILYKGGKPIWRQSGAITKTQIQDALDDSL